MSRIPHKSIGSLVAVFALSMLLFAESVHAKQRLHQLVIETESYTRTVIKWKSALDNSKVHQGSKTWIGPVKGNGVGDKKHRSGNRNTIIYMPARTKINEPVDLIFFFHGLRGFGTRDFETRILSRSKQLSDAGHNFLVIAPEMPWSQNTTTPSRRQSHVWRGSNRENIVTFYQTVRRMIEAHFLFHMLPRTTCMLHNLCNVRIGKLVIVGHSAGGSAIRMAAASGGLDTIRPNRLVFSDAGYGRWTDQTWKHYVKDHTSTQWVILVRKWDRPHRNTERFFKRLRRIPENIVYRVFSRKTHGHGTIGDECLLWAYPTGR